MKKEVYRVLGFYPPLNQSAATNYWIARGIDETELPQGFDADDIEHFADQEVKAGDVLSSGMAIVKVTTTVPAEAVLRKTVI